VKDDGALCSDLGLELQHVAIERRRSLELVHEDHGRRQLEVAAHPGNASRFPRCRSHVAPVVRESTVLAFVKRFDLG
jgi:hypothetical protein